MRRSSETALIALLGLLPACHRTLELKPNEFPKLTHAHRLQRFTAKDGGRSIVGTYDTVVIVPKDAAKTRGLEVDAPVRAEIHGDALLLTKHGATHRFELDEVDHVELSTLAPERPFVLLAAGGLAAFFGGALGAGMSDRDRSRCDGVCIDLLPPLMGALGFGLGIGLAVPMTGRLAGPEGVHHQGWLLGGSVAYTTFSLDPGSWTDLFVGYEVPLSTWIGLRGEAGPMVTSYEATGKAINGSEEAAGRILGFGAVTRLFLKAGVIKGFSLQLGPVAGFTVQSISSEACGSSSSSAGVFGGGLGATVRLSSNFVFGVHSEATNYEHVACVEYESGAQLTSENAGNLRLALQLGYELP